MQSNLINYLGVTSKEGDVKFDNLSKETQLEFTGNWFIDAGILGFVNLMEEVYGWDLEKLRGEIRKSPYIVYYGYFPFAYLFYHSKIKETYKKIGGKNEKIRNKKTKLNEENRALTNAKDEKKKQKILKNIEKIKEYIGGFEKDKDELIENISKEKINFQKRINSKIAEILKSDNAGFNNTQWIIDSMIPDFNLNPPASHRNFFLYNPKKDIFISFNYLYWLLCKDFSKIKLIRAFKKKEPFYNFVNYCMDLGIKPELIVEDVEKMYLDGGKKKEVINSLVEMYLPSNKKQQEFIKFIKEIYKNIKQECDRKGMLISYEEFPDSTINPFLFPQGLENLSYTLPLTLEQTENSLSVRLPIYLPHLSFYNSFEFIGGRNITFYVNNLDICYKINTKIKSKLKFLRKRGSHSVFQITLASIIDTLIEEKSKFSLENMYLVEYGNIKNLKLKGVEYIGIPKLQASIILDERIRDALNKSIEVQRPKKNTFDYIWLLEELIKNKPLYPIISKHLWLGVTKKLREDNHQVKSTASLYALAIDANIKQFNENNTNRIFSDDFFGSYEWLVDKIKGDYRKMSRISYDMTGLFKNPKDREKMIHPLFSAIESHNKKAFLHALIKNLLDKGDKEKIGYFNTYLFGNILNNDVSWENYGLSLLVNIT